MSKHPASRSFPLLVAALGSLSAACYDRPTYVERTPLPSESNAPSRSQLANSEPLLESSLPAGPVLERMSSFAARVAGETASERSIGCFPLVSYDLVHEGPWVSELGESLADHVADELAAAHPDGWVLGPRDLAIRAADSNVPREALSSLTAVREHGQRLGVDVIVFGTIRHREDSRNDKRSELVIEVSAYDLQRGRIVAQDDPFRLPSDNAANAQAWRLATEDGTWLPASDWPMAEENLSFDRELAVLCELLARRVAHLLTAEQVVGKVYVPPADTSRYVQSTSTLRTAQLTFARELERREQAAAAGRPVDPAAPLVLDGVEFPSIQVAEDYLTKLGEDLAAGPTMRFARAVSDLLAEALRPELASGTVVNDLGFTKWSDSQLVAGELALGGLPRSKVARDALAAQGVSHVVALRIDELGRNFQLRVEVLDLARENFAGTTYVPIPLRYAVDLRRELDAEGLTPLPPVEPRPTSSSRAAGWDHVYEEAVAGVVQILDVDRGFSGTGFLVSKDGLVMTNSHVVSGMSPSTVAIWKDGVERKLVLVEDAPEVDLAVLRLDSVPRGVHVFEFADDGDARVGRDVAVIGNPKGTSGWVITDGILSSVDESVVVSGAVRPSYMYTCATRKGNSGSPVLLRDGRVIAVNSHGALGDIYDPSGSEVQSSAAKGSAVAGELPGFARGAPAREAVKLLARAKTRG